MANFLNSNPIRIDNTTGGSWTGTKFVTLIQWVDLNEDIADSDMLLMTINGVPVEAEIQIDADDLSLGGGAVAWEIGPFSRGVPMTDVTVTTLDGGVVYFWLV
jgi:hypothetical protein